MPTIKLTPSFVKTAAHRADPAKPADRTIYWHESLSGFGLMVTGAGHKSYVVQYRANGASRRFTIKGSVPLKAALKQAKGIIGQVAKGADPVAEKREAEAEPKTAIGGTLKLIAEDYMKRDGKKLRSRHERDRVLNKYIYPKLGSHQIDEIRRKDVVELLDKIEDDGGPVMADHVLAVLRKIFNWHAARSDEFRSPLVKGMTRAAPAKDRARTRILSDAELRAFCRAAEAFPGAFGHLLRFILLTATRLREASNMTRDEIDGTIWTIPAGRHKSKKEFELPLSKAAAKLLSAVPKIGKSGWVFTHDGRRPIGGFGKFKRDFDKAMLAELHKTDGKAKLPGWVIHDLRRTARSLMSRAGVLPRHAEMALGHVVAGVEGVYDRHRYLDEKRSAFEALAQQIDRILNPQSNVVPMRGANQTLTAAEAH
jgi:integrase